MSRLLHEDPVVPLSGHARVGEAQDGAESVDAQVALPAAALPARGCRVLQRASRKLYLLAFSMTPRALRRRLLCIAVTATLFCHFAAAASAGGA